MAKPKATKKGKKTKAPRKAQPLPRSVQALLKYLGGSDVKLGGARGGQPATLAPTSINIAVSQQQAQQQAQQQQFVQQRVAPKGQIIGQSPLTQVISQQPIILGLPQRVSDREDNEKKMEQEKQSEVKQNEINRKLGLLETSQKDFERAAIGAYQDVKRNLSLRVAGDANIFDARSIATRFTQRPVVEEQQLPGVQVGEEAPVDWTDITDVGAFQAGRYIGNVTNPEMTPIERAKRGRKPLNQEVKAARAAELKLARETAKELKASVRQPRATKKTTKSDVSSLLEENVTTQNVLKNITESSNIIRFPKGGFLGRKPVSTVGAPDMATQIAMLTGGGAAAPSLSQGRTIAELLGASKKK